MTTVASAILIFCSIALLIFGTLIWECEHAINPQFVSIPQAVWWTWVTMTAVGYGDVVPISAGGKVLGFLTIGCGLCLTALILMIVGQYYCDNVEMYKREIEHITTIMRNKGHLTKNYKIKELDESRMSIICKDLLDKSEKRVKKKDKQKDEFQVISEAIGVLDTTPTKTDKTN